MTKQIKKQEIYFVAKYIGEQIAGKPEDEKTEFSALVINSFKKLTRNMKVKLLKKYGKQASLMLLQKKVQTSES